MGFVNVAAQTPDHHQLIVGQGSDRAFGDHELERREARAIGIDAPTGGGGALVDFHGTLLASFFVQWADSRHSVEQKRVQ